MSSQSDTIIFDLPVTKQFLEQFILLQNQAGVSLRDAIYNIKILFNIDRSIGWAHNVIQKAAQKAFAINDQEDLSNIKVSANDELFDHNKPILTGVCTNSLYCPFLEKKKDRKAETWSEVIAEAMLKSYNPASVILDGLNSLHLGHKQSMEDVNIVYDTFHVIKDLKDLRRLAKNKLKSSITNLATIEDKICISNKKTKIRKLERMRVIADKNYKTISELYRTISTLCSWMQHDILKVAGDSYSLRLELLEFIIDEFKKIEDNLIIPDKIRQVRKRLQNNKNRIIGFMKDLENELASYANELNCDVYWLWQICYSQKYSKDKANYYKFIAKTKSRLKHKFYEVEKTVIAIMDEIEKASSVVENLNGRIRKFLRNHIHVSQQSLNLLRFILNHKEFERSRCEHRNKKSPAEVLHRKPHNHWLTMLGYKLFKQPKKAA